MQKIRKNYIPYNGYYNLKAERSLGMNKEWFELEIVNVQNRISTSAPGSEERAKAIEELKELTRQLMEYERIMNDKEKNQTNLEIEQMKAWNENKKGVRDLIKLCVSILATCGITLVTLNYEETKTITSKIWGVISGALKLKF